MTGTEDVTVTGTKYWLDNPGQLARLLATSSATVIRDPSGQPLQPNEVIVLTRRELWAENPSELRDALAFVAGERNASATSSPTAASAVEPVENRLVLTVEEAAQLLGISRSFAYEAVQRGEIPSMRIGRRILVPKAALVRFLETAGELGGEDEA